MLFKHIKLYLSIADYHKYYSAIEKLTKEEVWLVGYKYNVSCSETVSKNWTQSAVDCYLLGCSCSKCNLYKIYFLQNKGKCRMKETVIELVRRFGAPEGIVNVGKG